MKLPQPVFINTTGDFQKFYEVLKTIAEKNLYPEWEWSTKDGGKILTEINLAREGVRVAAQNTNLGTMVNPHPHLWMRSTTAHPMV